MTKAREDSAKARDSKASARPSVTTKAHSSKSAPSPADFAQLPAKYSNTQAGMNWWSFHIRTMTTGQRYLYIGLIIFVTVFVGCMVGLCIDSLLRQEATYAYGGIVVGSLAALIIVYTQLRQLVDEPKENGEKPKNRPRAKLSRASTKKLSDEEKELIAKAKAEIVDSASNDDKPTDSSCKTNLSDQSNKPKATQK